MNNKAFTLIELMIVVFILGVTAAVIVPNFSGFAKGHRLKTSVKSVIVAGRYARSVSVLRQRETALIFDMDNSKVSVAFADEIEEQKKSEIDDGIDFEETEAGNFEILQTQEVEKVSSAENLDGLDAAERMLDGMIILQVQVGSEKLGDVSKLYTEGLCQALYYTNGRCEPYSVQLAFPGESEAKVMITVGPLGEVDTTYYE